MKEEQEIKEKLIKEVRYMEREEFFTRKLLSGNYILDIIIHDCNSKDLDLINNEDIIKNTPESLTIMIHKKVKSNNNFKVDIFIRMINAINANDVLNFISNLEDKIGEDNVLIYIIPTPEELLDLSFETSKYEYPEF